MKAWVSLCMNLYKKIEFQDYCLSRYRTQKIIALDNNCYCYQMFLMLHTYKTMYHFPTSLANIQTSNKLVICKSYLNKKCKYIRAVMDNVFMCTHWTSQNHISINFQKSFTYFPKSYMCVPCNTLKGTLLRSPTTFFQLKSNGGRHWSSNGGINKIFFIYLFVNTLTNNTR